MKKAEKIKETMTKINKWLDENYQARGRKPVLSEHQIARNKELPIKCMRISIIKKRILLEQFNRGLEVMSWRAQEAARLEERELRRVKNEINK